MIDVRCETTVSGTQPSSPPLPTRWLFRITIAMAICCRLADGALQAQPPADPAALRARLDSILTGHGVKGAVLGAQVIELPSGRVLYEAGAERALIPASNAKLIVIAAAFDLLSPDYEFKTTLALRGDDLVLIGGGDPALGDPRLCQSRGEQTTSVFHRWAEALQRAGVQRVSGRLLVDDSIFEKRFVHPTWPPNQYQEWYEAPIGGLNFADNCVEVFVSPGQRGGAAVARLSPANTFMRVANQTRSNGKHAPSIRRAAGSESITVSGSVARESMVGEIAVTDPGMFTAACLKTVLAAKGIEIRGGIERATLRTGAGDLPADLRIIAVEKTRLIDAARRAGKDSLGMMAEGLLKILGAERGGGGTWNAGAAVVSGFMAKCGVTPGQFQFADGSGLSRDNRLSAAATTAVLRHMFTHPSAREFREVLAVCGVDGTLKRRMRDISGMVVGKTGYIDRVRTLSGYAQTRTGARLAFAIFYNDAANTSVLSGVQDNACRAMVNWGAEPSRGAGRAASVGAPKKAAARRRRG